MPAAELEVENLKVTFSTPDGELTAVNGIGYRLFRGETLAIVGESGCGKSVGAMALLGLIPRPPGKIAGGEIRLGSRAIPAASVRELRTLRGKEIAMIFQDPMTSLNPVFTIGEQIMETILRHTPLSRRRAREKTADLLRRVEIDRLSVYPHQLSGGMRQRAMIAMALSCNPRILIADEPTTALYVLIQAQILGLLNELKRETDLSVILISHDLGVVAEVAQRVLVMYAGEIVESGPVQDLFASPLHPYTEGLLNSLPRLAATRKRRQRLTEIKGSVPSLNEMPGGCPFHPRCPSVMERCKTQKPALLEIRPRHQTACWLHEA